MNHISEQDSSHLTHEAPSATVKQPDAHQRKSVAGLMPVVSILAATFIINIVFLKSVWLSILVLFLAIVTTIVHYRKVKKENLKHTESPELSHGSMCVWQMDREA